MSEDGLATPLSFTLPPALASDGHEIVAEDRGPDPLDMGFLLLGGVLAPLPRRVRLPHEPDDDDEAEDEADGPPGGEPALI